MHVFMHSAPRKGNHHGLVTSTPSIFLRNVRDQDMFDKKLHRLDSIAVISSHLGSNVQATLHRKERELDSRHPPVFSDERFDHVVEGYFFRREATKSC